LYSHITKPFDFEAPTDMLKGYPLERMARRAIRLPIVSSSQGLASVTQYKNIVEEYGPSTKERKNERNRKRGVKTPCSASRFPLIARSTWSLLTLIRHLVKSGRWVPAVLVLSGLIVAGSSFISSLHP
jgi:hypothetical protein